MLGCDAMDMCTPVPNSVLVPTAARTDTRESGSLFPKPQAHPRVPERSGRVKLLQGSMWQGEKLHFWNYVR